MSDEIIAEVQAIKDAIGAKFNYNLRTLFEEIKRCENELETKGMRLIHPSVDPAKFTNTALQRTRLARRRIQHQE